MLRKIIGVCTVALTLSGCGGVTIFKGQDFKCRSAIHSVYSGKAGTITQGELVITQSTSEEDALKIGKKMCTINEDVVFSGVINRNNYSYD